MGRTQWNKDDCKKWRASLHIIGYSISCLVFAIVLYSVSTVMSLASCHTCIVWRGQGRRQECYKRGWALWRVKRNFRDHAPFKAWSRHLHSRQLHTSSLAESLGSAWFTLLFKNLSRVCDISWLFVHPIRKPFVGCTMKKKDFWNLPFLHLL